MCGIAGKFNTHTDIAVGRHEIERMLRPMSHRGPDGQGFYLDGQVGLGHLRLAIIDVDGGPQPMPNEDESVWIVFNGEIYNFQPLRDELIARGHKFRSRSDTEVIIHLYEEYGIDCLRRLRGMFAFAIWDKPRRRLFIARDRVGIKPLYYCHTPDSFYFASELKAIIADPTVSREINRNSVRRFFSFTYVPGEETLLNSIRKLPPGHFVVAENGKIKQERYWDLQFTRARADKSFDDVVQELYALLGSTVRDHMIADVPVGVLLSGGVDSTAVLNFAVKGTEKKVKTFTVGFGGTQVVDERPYARLAAERFGTEHHEITITAEDFWNFLPSYVHHMEEPVCEPPAIALHYVSQLAQKHVKVLLSGEGGDEAFAGYPNYPNQLKLERIRQKLGPLARTAGMTANAAGRLFGVSQLRRYGSALGRPLNEHYFSRRANPATFFNRTQQSFFTADFRNATRSASPTEFMTGLLASKRDWPLLDQMLYADSKTWLPDDLLIKADKITMASSLELRVPLLDHEVLEFAASLPQEYKVQGTNTKRALKAAFAKVLPEEILNRKKVGFPVPYGDWLRGPLADRVRETLLSQRAVGRGYFRTGQVEKLLQANKANGEYSSEVFGLLAMELWHCQFIDSCAPAK